jgi:hypothetical protein
MAKPELTKRRFAPVHIETTFESVRFPKRPLQGGPNPELTPEPSPRSLSPVPAELRVQRRFAPQLIETSRRARRVGDVGPATRPTDKTDITPYTNHIYVHRSKSKRRLADDEISHAEVKAPTRRESEDEDVSGYLLDLAAREAERQINEAALAAFPNSRAREGGVAHFYFRENSEDESTPESDSPPVGVPGPKKQTFHPRVLRRKSSDLGWWHKAMQEHAEKLAQDREAEPPQEERQHTSDDDLDGIDIDGPPDAYNLTTTRLHRGSSRLSLPGPGSRGPIGEFQMPLIEADPYVVAQHKPYVAPSSPILRPIGETVMPYIPSAPPGRAADMAYRPAPAAPAYIPPDTGFRNAGGFGGGPFSRPFGGMAEREFRNMRNAASPPMLGDDLKFRKCPSPKQTKLEPDHKFAELEMDEKNRDLTGQGGLWRGYCFRNSTSDEGLVPPELHGPPMMHTPMPPATPGDPFASAFGNGSVTDEPVSTMSTLLPIPIPGSKDKEHRSRMADPKGIHMLHGIDERLRKAKAAAELDEKIASEFNDEFVTQVYNYLSLGYPALARAFDEELGKISRIPVSDLQRDDEQIMAQKGHMVDMNVDETPEESRCPRWRALKTYIYEWARQHPDLDSLDPLAWGVRERRGSWAI